MENGQFEDVFPIEHAWGYSCAMLVYQSASCCWKWMIIKWMRCSRDLAWSHEAMTGDWRFRQLWFATLFLHLCFLDDKGGWLVGWLLSWFWFICLWICSNFYSHTWGGFETIRRFSTGLKPPPNTMLQFDVIGYPHTQKHHTCKGGLDQESRGGWWFTTICWATFARKWYKEAN